MTNTHWRGTVIVLSILTSMAVNISCESDSSQAEPQDESATAREHVQIEAPQGFEDLRCPGNGEDPSGEEIDWNRAVYGQAFLPDTRRADSAVMPMADIRVTLVAAQAAHTGDDDQLQTTTTDADGRWCLLLAAREEDRSLPSMVIASGGQETLRAPVFGPGGPIDIDGPTEALLRILSEEGIPIKALSEEAYFSIFDELDKALARTDGVRPRAGGGLTSYLARLRETLGDDERFVSAVDDLYRQTLSDSDD